MARGRTPRVRNNAKCNHPKLCACKTCIERRSKIAKNEDHNEDKRSMKEKLEAIEYHWRTFSPETKHFLLNSPNDLTLERMIKFWSSPDHIELTNVKVAVGTSFLLAFEYMNINNFAKAKALTLNGAFLQQCCYTPVENLVKTPIEELTEDVLPYFFKGAVSTQSPQNMDNFLRKSLPLKYRKMMGFASHSANRPAMGYVSLISDDWNSTAHTKQHNNISDGPEISVILTNTENGTSLQKRIAVSMTMKSLFNDYADDSGLSLRSLRFSYNGKTLFLSSVGHKTPNELGMLDNDVIHVSSNNSTGPENIQQKPAQTVMVSKPKNKRPNNKSSKKKKSKKGVTGSQRIVIPENKRIHHSLALSKVFEEAEPKFKQIRQQLNMLTLECRCPKEKVVTSRKKSDNTTTIVFNPCADGIGGKAGKTSYAVNVGRVENLYKTSKKSSQQRSTAKPTCMAKIDLHGCTRNEALAKLDSSLPQWVDTAMHGSYPWVMPVLIVCGGGNQILSETVECWIKKNEHVANAPKGNIFANSIPIY